MVPIQNPTLFWDIRPEEVDLIEHKKWLIERVAQWGTLDDIRELLRIYPMEEIAQIIADSRTIDPKTKELWIAMGRDQGMHQDVLPERTREVWEMFSEIGLEQGFVLAGGTALALRLGHRESEDLDFFRNEHFNTASILNNLMEKSTNSSDLEIVLQEPKDTLHVRFRQVKLSFLFQAGKHLAAYDLWNGVRIASIDAIVAMKLNAVAGRGERKDFIDLYTICQDVMDFDEMLRRGFALLPNLNRYHILRSLVYFQDAEQTPPLRLFRDYSWSEVKQFFSRKVTRYLSET